MNVTIAPPSEEGGVLYFNMLKGQLDVKTTTNPRQPLCSAWSGCAGYRNRPHHARRAGKGPIPPGYYWLGSPVDTALGRCCFPLWPYPETETFGRTGFWLHGGLKLRHDSGSVIVFDVRDRRTIARLQAHAGSPFLLVVLDQPPF